MGKSFDTLFIYWIDRIVWFILFVVILNLVAEITGYSTGSRSAVDYRTEKSNEIIVSAKLNEAEPPKKDVEELTSNEIDNGKPSKKKPVNDGSNRPHNILSSADRNEIFNNIFNIPITTLQTVNTLVKNIVNAVLPDIRSFNSFKNNYKRINSIELLKNFTTYSI